MQMESRVSYRSRAGNQINLERRDCTLRDGRTRVPCVDVEVFMKYDGEGVPDRIGQRKKYHAIIAVATSRVACWYSNCH